MKYSVITFGCRVNQADSLGFEEELRAAGATAVPADAADLVIVNTCSVTASADQGARQAIRRVARANPGAKIVVTGCYATRRPDELAGLPNVARVVHNDDKPRLIPRKPPLVRSVSFRLRSDRWRRIFGGKQPDRDCDEPTTAARFGDGEGSCGAAIEPGVAAAPPSRFACRPAAHSRARTASSRRRGAGRAACRSITCFAKSSA
jgi:hypothetical protein